MFETSFFEMLLIGVVALLVIGPERLPGLARKAGRLLGKAKAFIATTRTDLERELRTEEMRSMLNKQEDEIRALRDLMQQNTTDVRHSIEDATKPHDEKH
ncbi:twin-arginine translocase subunit TatB [Thiothrix litoralis]|uniref:Twin-arginine translocase subunit TatB n=1 Tax=Thiothrix litoralis TaxID=2891210 RepID=A0ABX7WWB4_9GAMM|nr:Sec-independent protein translocase protein TatB [Thiothrix litoralis]QTR45944.1 twin-arginine translocase subunit TatB [Thiothrix litoralis]